MLANIFKNPEILDKKVHKDLKLSPYANYEFTKDVYLSPIGLEEILVAMKSVIIVFVKDESGDIYPSVVLGGEEGGNLLLSKENTWKENKYIPAALRCYPFGLGSDGKNSFITVDAKAELFEQEGGNLIIKDEESLTDAGENAINFVTTVYNNIHTTKEFSKLLNSLGILKQAEISIKMNKEEYTLKSGIYIVDENALNKLESRKIKKLATGGFMKFVYAHLLSLNNTY
ncbi:SapC family protein [Sulfurimonas sp. SAG-AH-194-I05]|nr:SapC family protein [Sulfurimonas sp. SAG-AH-194-I05]MDF1875736.1 SapC family protein [Sulfurimonas sp. SAG-AH-194-I05]